MKFQLSREGTILGEFTLEELRAGRETGQFLENDVVWRSGMSQWQALDDCLREHAPPPRFVTPPPIPITPEQRRNRLVTVVAVALGLLFVGGVVFVGLSVGKIIRRVQPSSGAAGRDDALAAARQPVVVGTNSTTAAVQRARHRAFRVRQWIEGYQQNAARNPACDAEALRFLEGFIDQGYGDGTSTNAVNTRELADKLAGPGGCEDPLILAIAGVEAYEVREAARRLNLAVKGFESSRHKAYPRFYALVQLAERQSNRPDLVAQSDAAALAQLRACFQDASLAPADDEEIAEILILGWGADFFKRNGAAVLAGLPTIDGNSREWLSLTLAGQHHINEAWRLRGGGYAGTVTAEGWRGFNTELAEASTCLTKAWKLRPDQPIAACRMIYVSMGLASITEMRVWFDRTVAAQFDYGRAWSDLRFGLRERWYGDEQAMRAFGETALNTGRFDTDVPRILFDSIRDMELDLNLAPCYHLYGRADLWPLLQRMYEGYLAEPKQAAWRDGWRSAYAVVAHLAGKYDVARQQLEALDWHPHARNLHGWGTDVSLMPLEVAAASGPLAAEVLKTDALRDEEKFSEALAAYRELAKDPRADQRTREFFRHRTAVLEIETRLRRGEWVDLLPQADDDPAWNAQLGEYRVLPGGDLEVRSGKEGHLIICRARVGVAWELRGEFELVSSSAPGFQAGVVMGMPDSSDANWFSFRMKNNLLDRKVASYAEGWTRRERRAEVPVETSTRFELQFNDGLLSASVNGQRSHERAKAPPQVTYSPQEFLVGLGAFSDSNETVLRYRRVQLRLVAPANSPARY